ncbi:nitrous oxide-stimulated promoter family protein [Paenibacillus sp. CAU 1782]
MAKGRILSEKKTIAKMVVVYCKGNRHPKPHLCPECQELLDYAHKRLDNCQFGEEKSFCEQCPVHCYKRDMREKIKLVMRFSGPRMLIHDPPLAIKHLILSAAYRYKKSKGKVGPDRWEQAEARRRKRMAEGGASGAKPERKEAEPQDRLELAEAKRRERKAESRASGTEPAQQPALGGAAPDRREQTSATEQIAGPSGPSSGNTILLTKEKEQ